VIVRAATEDDWEESLEIRLRALADAPDSFRRTLAEAREQAALWPELAREGGADPGQEGWLAEENGVPVGQAFSRISEDGTTVHIYAMWVGPEARGHGVGRALLAAIETWGRDRGSRRGYLAVTAGNVAAEHLYRSAGYEPTGDCEPLREGTDLECVWMAKKL
jgi:GNAT superfamily N-acetyltransferase